MAALAQHTRGLFELCADAGLRKVGLLGYWRGDGYLISLRVWPSKHYTRAQHQYLAISMYSLSSNTVGF
jgi:hypothetical protein